MECIEEPVRAHFDENEAFSNMISPNSRASMWIVNLQSSIPMTQNRHHSSPRACVMNTLFLLSHHLVVSNLPNV